MSNKPRDDSQVAEWEQWIGSCAMLHGNGKCIVEKKFMCSPENMTCTFHKTADEKAASEELWRKIMNERPRYEQEYYADLYFNGNMPWKKGEKAYEEDDCQN